MEDERGLSSRTIEVWCRYLKKFLRWYEVKKRPFSEVNIIAVDAFLMSCGKNGLSRVSINNIATGLRSFFGYAGMKGWFAPFLAEAIKGPRIFAQENLPLGPSRHDVSSLIAGMDTNRPRDIRNRASVARFRC